MVVLGGLEGDRNTSGREGRVAGGGRGGMGVNGVSGDGWGAVVQQGSRVFLQGTAKGWWEVMSRDVK